MRAPVASLLSVWSAGLLLLLSPWARSVPGIDRPDRLLAHVVILGVLVCACWAIVGLTPNHPRAALIVLRVALMYATLQAFNAVLPL